jgi:hypothetical protein
MSSVCFKLADWFQRRRLLNNFPIGSYVKTMSVEGGHFGLRLGSLNTILEVDHLRTIDDMFAILAYWFQREWSLNGQLSKLYPVTQTSPSKMAIISGHSFNIGPYGKYV